MLVLSAVSRSWFSSSSGKHQHHQTKWKITILLLQLSLELLVCFLESFKL
jgi:hypothetical protein